MTQPIPVKEVSLDKTFNAMAKRQFTDSDTDLWLDRYTNGSAGDKAYTANHTLDSSDGFYNSVITGNVNTKNGNVSLADGTYNLPCKIIQSQGTGATDDPNWEFNVLISVSGGVATFKYNLTKNYVTGAQIITGNPYRSITINNGVTLTVPAWDGSKGGEFVQFALVKWDNSNGGTVSLQGVGFRGGSGSGAPAQQGESYNGTGTYSHSANNTGGGGGDHDINNYPWFASASGGGGGNATAGQGGYWIGGANMSTNGAGGSTSGNTNLTTMLFGGGAGRGGQNSGNAGGYAGNGGGNITIVSQTILCGNVNLGGTQGSGGSGDEGVGGSGAGGSGIFKGQSVALGSLTASGGASYTHGYDGGGAGGQGRLHVDTSDSTLVTGSSTPSATVSTQHVLATVSGAILTMIM